MQPTTAALIACADWLVKCLSYGWSKRDLDFLQELWWKYHDHTGELIQRKDGAK